MSVSRLPLLILGFTGITATALAQTSLPAQPPPTSLTGTPEQRAACGPDVGKFCKSVKSAEGTAGYVACLVENHEKLSEACRNVLDKEIK